MTRFSTIQRSKRSMLADLAAAGVTVASQPPARLVAKNTLEYWEGPDAASHGGAHCLRLHETEVFRQEPGGVVTLNSGGWRTVTTKNRINSMLPAGWGIYSQNGWRVRTPYGEGGTDVPFLDGAKFHGDGLLMEARRYAAQEARIQRERKQIAGYIIKLKAKGWGDPAGDPLIQPDAKTGLFQIDAVRDWIAHGYVTRQLVATALRDRFTPEGVEMFLRDFERGRRDNFLTSIVRRYLKRCLQHGV